MPSRPHDDDRSEAEQSGAGEFDRGSLELPGYAERLYAYHRVHRKQLQRIVRSLPIAWGTQVLDVACGDATFGILMAARGADVRCIDLDADYLRFAERRVREAGVDVCLDRGNAEALDYEDDSFDGAFCAQSFYSLPNVHKVLEEMRRVVRPGGWVAALENDTIHRVVLPWPPELELKLRLAERRALLDQRGDANRYYIGRCLGAELTKAGLSLAEVRPFATHRRAPLSRDERTYLASYLEELLRRALGYLKERDRDEALRLASPSSPDYMLDTDDFSVTYLDILAWARVPG